MNLKFLFTQTIENSGATITRDGERLTKGVGFLVSREGYETRIAGTLDYPTFVSCLLEYQTLINESVELAGCVVGFWYSELTSAWYIDVSERILDRGIAERLGKHRKQLAIFDLENGEAISLA